MTGREVTVVRVYLHEGDAHLREVLRYLHDESEVRGVTMYRGVMGYGADHKVRSASLSDLSLDLPVVLEVVDEPQRCVGIVERLQTMVEPSHVVWWNARCGGEQGPG
jgi:PII-like signaling protein